MASKVKVTNQAPDSDCVIIEQNHVIICISRMADGDVSIQIKEPGGLNREIILGEGDSEDEDED